MQGLTSQQAQELLKQYGLNIVSEHNKKSSLRIFTEQFNNFLTILLILASIISFLIGNNFDGVLIVLVVILNACFGFYQEYKAEEAAYALSEMAITKTYVIRDGKTYLIDSRLLVPKDIIMLVEGTKIPADAKLLEAYNLETNEAPLTGESLSIVKKTHDPIYMGTIVIKGRGMAQVTETGQQTKFGHIAQKLSEVKETKSPLQKKLARLSFFLGFFGIAAAILVFGLSIFIGSSLLLSFLLAIALAVAVVPEGLPVILTITLSIGAREMSKKKAVLRKLTSIEALGNLTLIATDKTGTLTEGKMEVKEIYLDKKIFDKNNLPFPINRSFDLLILNNILSSTILNDPTEKAILALIKKIGINVENIKNEWKFDEEIPFNSKTKMMSVVVNNKSQYVFTKGAPESVLNTCSKILINNKEEDLNNSEKKQIEKIINDWGRKGLRVLGFGYNNHVFLGLIALADPLRREAKESVQKAHEMGIKVVMITGDNAKTAEAIGLEAGIVGPHDKILTGKEIDKLDDRELLNKLNQVKIFARTTPEQKYRITKLFQKKGEIVGVTGDGINDSIALKQADVGIAMGKTGTDVAREEGDMIITDDNFATIINAITEGRNTINNLKKSIKYLLTGNLIEVTTIVSSLFLGIPALFYATQILYINLITDGIPALALASAPKTPLTRLLHPSNSLGIRNDNLRTLVSRSDLIYISSVALLASLLVLFAYFFYNYLFDEGVARTAAFTLLILCQSFIFIDLWKGSIRKWLFVFGFFLPFVIHYFAITIPFLSIVFKISTISPLLYIVFIMLSAIILPAIKLTGINKMEES